MEFTLRWLRLVKVEVFRVGVRIFRMLGRGSFAALFVLAAVIPAGVAGQEQTARTRPDYPILQEIRVDQNCRIFVADTQQIADKKKPRFVRDHAICHIETRLSSEHIEEGIVGDQLLRNRVKVVEHEFLLQNIAADPVVFVVRQAVPKGWRVDSDPQPSEMDGAVAIFRVHAAPGEIVRLHVGERHTTSLQPKVIRAGVAAGAVSN